MNLHNYFIEKHTGCQKDLWLIFVVVAEAL